MDVNLKCKILIITGQHLYIWSDDFKVPDIYCEQLALSLIIHVDDDGFACLPSLSYTHILPVLRLAATRLSCLMHVSNKFA